MPPHVLRIKNVLSHHNSQGTRESGCCTHPAHRAPPLRHPYSHHLHITHCGFWPLAAAAVAVAIAAAASAAGWQLLAEIRQLRHNTNSATR